MRSGCCLLAQPSNCRPLVGASGSSPSAAGGSQASPVQRPGRRQYARHCGRCCRHRHRRRRQCPGPARAVPGGWAGGPARRRRRPRSRAAGTMPAPLPARPAGCAPSGPGLSRRRSGWATTARPPGPGGRPAHGRAGGPWIGCFLPTSCVCSPGRRRSPRRRLRVGRGHGPGEWSCASGIAGEPGTSLLGVQSRGRSDTRRSERLTNDTTVQPLSIPRM